MNLIILGISRTSISRSVVGIIAEALRRKKVDQILNVYSKEGKPFLTFSSTPCDTAVIVKAH